MSGYSRMRPLGSQGFKDMNTYLFQEADLMPLRADSFHASNPSFLTEYCTFGLESIHSLNLEENGESKMLNIDCGMKPENLGTVDRLGELFRKEHESVQSGFYDTVFTDSPVQRTASILDRPAFSTSEEDSFQDEIGGAFPLGSSLQRSLSSSEGGQLSEGFQNDAAQADRSVISEAQRFRESPTEGDVGRALPKRDLEARAVLSRRSFADKGSGASKDPRREKSEDLVTRNASPRPFSDDRPRARRVCRRGDISFEKITTAINPEERLWPGSTGERPWRGSTVAASPEEKRREEQEERQEQQQAPVGLSNPWHRSWDYSSAGAGTEAWTGGGGGGGGGGQHSQSMRYDRVEATSFLGFEEDEEWAEYARNGNMGGKAEGEEEEEEEGAGEEGSESEGEEGEGEWCESCGRRVLLSSSVDGNVSKKTMMMRKKKKKVCWVCSRSSLFVVPPPPPSFQEKKKSQLIIHACKKLLGIHKKLKHPHPRPLDPSSSPPMEPLPLPLPLPPPPPPPPPPPSRTP